MDCQKIHKMKSLNIKIPDDFDEKKSKLKQAYYDFLLWFEEKIVDKYVPFFIWVAYTRAKRIFHENITCRINPRQRWLVKKIPKTWCDKPELIPILLYEMVIHFVEKEECFKVTDWAGSGIAEEEKQLKEIYQWAKTGRNEFLNKIDKAYPNVVPTKENPFSFVKEDGSPTSFKDYDLVFKLEKEFEEYDRECLIWIVKNRAILWT